MHRFSLLVLLCATSLTLPETAQAQSRANDPGKVIDDLIACRNVTDSGARLACLDRATAAIAGAREQRQIVVLDREGVRQAKRSVFGFSMPRIKLFGGGDDEPEVSEITDHVASARDIGHGKWLLRLKDGTVWQTTEAQLGFDAKVGEPIHIQSGTLGSYRASVNKGRVVRVKRVQ